MDKLDVELRKHKFILFCEDHYNPLNVLRSLGEVGINAIVIQSCEHPVVVNHSRYITIYHRVDNIKQGYELLMKEYSNESIKPFLFHSSDNIGNLLDDHYDDLIDKFYFFNAGERKRLDLLQNKEEISNMAIKVGLEIPKSEVVNTGVLPKTLKYPIITKVLAPTMGLWKGDVYICHSEEELKEAYTKIQSPQLILQEYIYKKGEYSLEGFSVNHGEDAFFPMICNYIRLYDDSYGHYMMFSPLKDSELEARVRNLLKETKYEGIFEAEFMTGPNNEDYFLEINFRSSTWTYALTKMGGNAPYYWAKSMLAGQVVREDMKLDLTPFTAMFEFGDISQVFRKNVGLIQWIKEFLGSKCTYLYDANDKKPFFSYLWSKIARRF